MQKISVKKLAFIVISTLVFISCQFTSPDIPVSIDSSPTVPIADSQDQPEVDTLEETPEPTEIPPTTELSGLSQGELIEKWRLPFATISLVAGSCDSMLQTAEKVESGEIDGFDAFAELLAVGLILTAAEEGIAEWDPVSDQLEYKQNIQNQIDNIRIVMGKWIDEEIVSGDIPELLGDECETAFEMAKEIGETAQGEGLTDDNLTSIIEDMETALDEWAAEIEEEPPQEISTEIGLSRSNPFLGTTLNSVPDWDIQITDTMRGEDAWELITSANQFNEPPPEGKEYILIKIKVISTATADEEHDISNWDFKLTGSRLIQYEPASVVVPDPELSATLFYGGDYEGWVVYTIDIDENNLILIFDKLLSIEDENIYFFALEEGTSIDFDETLKVIQPTELGMERSAPARQGDTVVTEDWEVTVLEVVRGEDAWSIIQETNQFNDPPDEGLEYVLARVKVRYIGISNEAMNIDKYSFESTGSENVLYELPSIVSPMPELNVNLFSGGEFEGWITLLAAEGESDLKAVFTPWVDWNDENKRFLSLE